jgi:Transposase DDE domain
MLPYSRTFDQRTLTLLMEHDAVVQRYRAFFALLDWQVLPDPSPDPSRPGKRPHPESAYIKALLVKITEGYQYCSQLRTFLVEHPLLVLELGFRPVLNCELPYGFDVKRTVPSERWLREKQRRLDHRHLQDLLHATVHALQEEIPGLGEVVAFDVKHQYAWVRENNPRESIKDRFCKERQPRGDPDCRVGVKSSTNQEQPDGSKKEKKEYLWGYGSGIATATTPDYGDVVVADLTQGFNESDVSYYLRLYIQSVAVLGRFPLHVTADAAYDAWYVYQTCAHREGIAAIPLNQHGHPDGPRDHDGVPLCPIGLRMHPTYRFAHTKGYQAQRYRCPLLFPERTGETCEHAQFIKDKGCVKDINIEKGGLMRAMLDRSSPLYHAVYCQRTSAERINSQAKALGIERPKVRQGRSVHRLNTLTYIVINVKALARARAINASLLTPKLGKVA